MVLNGQNHRVGGVHEGALLDGDENLSEADLAGESVAVVDDGLPLTSIPAVNCKYQEKFTLKKYLKWGNPSSLIPPSSEYKYMTFRLLRSTQRQPSFRALI